MRVEDLIPLEPAGERAWELDVPLRLCSGLRTLWGGVGLGAAVHVAEQATGRPCAWATVQYVSPVHPDDRLRLAVSSRDGRSLSQAQVLGTVGDRVVVQGLVALGAAGDTDQQYVRMPEDVPPPEDCAPRQIPLAVDPAGTILEELEQRWAQAPRPLRSDGVPGTGRTRVWMRLRRRLPAEHAVLAVIADVAPSAIAEALGVLSGGVSLDNTVRFARPTSDGPDGWVLVDVTVEAVVAEVAQLSARLFDRSGALLAVAGQSAVVRRRAEPRRRVEG